MKKYYLILFLNLFILQFYNPSYSQYPNIKIDDQDDPNEPSIMMDPKNPMNIVAGGNIYKVYTSSDGGFNWKANDMTSTYGVWGDPCIVVDTNSNFYFLHLANPPKNIGNWVDRIVCQKLTSIDGKWSDGTFAGLNGKKIQDKEWAYVDRKNNNIYVAWTQFDKYESSDPLDSSIIVFSKSADGGNTWTAPVRISEKGGDCLDGDNTAEGAVPCSGPNGEIYLSWSNAGVIYFDRSTDGGQTWLKKDTEVCKQPGSWDIKIAGIYRANGMPVTCSDLSNGPYRGTIYINFSYQKPGLPDTDIWLTKSTDGGNNWTEPKRVNDGPEGTQQFMSWMTIDQTSGYIYIVFYDRRNYNDTRTDVYLAYSTDGGETFTNTKISETTFTPKSTLFFGDYTNITAHNGKVVPIWTRTDNGNNSVWCTIIDNIVSSTKETKKTPVNNEIISKLYPNPSDNSFNLEIKIEKEAKYSIAIYNEAGKTVATILTDSILSQGNHRFHIKSKQYNLRNGSYFLIIKSQNNIDRRKLVIIEK